MARVTFVKLPMNPVSSAVPARVPACLLFLVLLFQGPTPDASAQFSGVYREVYSPLGAGTINALTNLPSFPGSPSSSNLLTNFDVVPRDAADQYGQRLRALVRAPTNGNYTFWINSDDQGTLHLGTNDTTAGLRLVAVEPNYSATTNWDSTVNRTGATAWFPAMNSALAANVSSNTVGSIYLVSNEWYYVEARSAEGFGGDNLSVGWQLPNGVLERPIPSSRLRAVGVPPPAISQDPSSQSIPERGSVTFSATVSSLNLNYRWQRNGTNIGGATATTYTLFPVSATNNNDRFRLVVTNGYGSVTSQEAVLTVILDSVRPTIVSVSGEGTNGIIVAFSEQVEAATAINAANYAIAGLTVSSAAFATSDGRTVRLTTTPLTLGQNYTLTASNVRDLAFTPNTILPGSQRTFTAQPLGVWDFGFPAFPGAVTNVPGGHDLASSGSDASRVSDQFLLGYRVITGDFDLQTRVDTVAADDAWARAGLMARETLDSNAVYAATFATPGAAGCFFQARTSIGGTYTNIGFFPANYPQTWLRLVRAGTSFTGFASTDGSAWWLLGTRTINASNTLLVGLALNSRLTNSPALAKFRSFTNTPASATLLTELPFEPAGPSSRRTPLAFTEIMYHPAPGPGTNLLEWIELYNSANFPQELSGLRISGDVDFTFPTNTFLGPGSYLVVANSPALVSGAYGITNVTGPYTNNLGNSGGTVRLREVIGAVLLETAYGTDAPWPISPDGAGPSLVLSRPSFGENDPRAWSASGFVGGSPGRAEPFSPNPYANVVINEYLAHTDLPQVDFIELYNHGNTAVDLSACWITDDVSTNKFAIPGGTTIPARGYIVFTETQLGYRLNAAGETILFRDPGLTRVIDAARFQGQENGVSSGRWPNGGSSYYRLAAPTPGASNGVIQVSSVVINELMYNPVSGLADDEYVEIHNRGASSTNIGGWRLRDGISFTIPSNTVLSAGSFLVVAKNASRLLTNYSQLNSGNTLGNFGGTLSNGGERIALSMPDDIVSTNALGVVKTNTIYIDVDEVAYNKGGRWPRWADGGGSSLELVDPRADKRQPSSWADSDESSKASAWVTIEKTANLDLGQGAADSLQLFLLGEGECLVDDVELIPNVLGTNIISEGSFPLGSTNWVAQGTHEFSAIIPTNGTGNGSALHVRALSRGDNGANRIRYSYGLDLTTNNTSVTIRAKARWLRGWPEILLRLRGNWAEATGRLPPPPNLGSPGLPNTRRVANAGPAISDVSHSPVIPQPNDVVRVTARVQDPDGNGPVVLRYRVEPSAAVDSLAMNDGGFAGDLVAGDGIYSANIPAQAAGSLVAFNILATDAAVSPAGATFPADAPVRECLVRWGEFQPAGSVGTYRLLMTATNITRWGTRLKNYNAGLDATFVYGSSRVVYNVGAYYSGSPFHTPSYNGPLNNMCDYVFEFPPDDLMLGSSDFVMASTGNIGSDSTGIRESVSFWILRKLGLPYLYRRPVHLFVNGLWRRTSNISFYEDAQQPNGDVVSQWFPGDADGNLHKVEDWFEFNDTLTGGSDGRLFNRDATLQNFTTQNPLTLAIEKKMARYRWNWRARSVSDSANDYAAMYRLVDALNDPSANFPTNAANYIDTDEWMRVFAFERVVGNWDSYGYQRGKNMYAYKPTQDRWNLFVWDVDFTLGLGHGATQSPINQGDANDPTVWRLYTNAPTRRAFFRGLQDAVNGPLQTAAYTTQIDGRFQGLQADNVAIGATTAVKTYLNDRRNFLQAFLATNGASSPFAATNGNGTTITNSGNLLYLGGFAPINTAKILINGVAYPVTWTGLTNWQLAIPLPARTNSLSIQGLNLAGQPVSGQLLALTAIQPNPVDLPEGFVVLNEIHYNPLQTNASFVELFNRSTTTAFDLSRWRINGADFAFPDGTVLWPNSFLLAVGGLGGFTNAFPSARPIVGVLGGKLGNTGERLQLLRPDSTGTNELVVAQVRYDSTAPWPTNANGTGPSLQLIDVARDNWRVANWASAAPTPGTTNSVSAALPAFPPLWINELQPNNLSGIIDRFGEKEPWMELHYSGTNSLVISNFFLGDSPTNLGRWQFPTTSTISTNQFLVVFLDNQPAQSSATEWHGAFRPSTTNGAVYLSRSLNGTTQIVDYLSYAFVPTNRSFGSAPDAQSVDRQQFFFVTPGTNNNPASAPTPVVISEWMADNAAPNGLADPVDGKFQDWFELYNPNTNAFDLSGYFLTDTLSLPEKWQIPNNTIIAPKGFLIVWADNEPLQNGLTADLHANFQLSNAGEAIGLFSPDGTPQSTVTFGPQFQNISQGRFPTGNTNQTYWFMTNSTPRSPNAYPAVNNAPSLAPTANRTVTAGLTLALTASGFDVDAPPQSLFYSLDPGAPAGASINPTTGFFAWQTSATNGQSSVLVTIRVSDDGVPAKSAINTFRIDVVGTHQISSVVRAPNGNVTLDWPSLIGRSYQVQMATNLTTSGWFNVGGNSAGTGQPMSLTDSAPIGAERYYRIIEQ